jgi:hypothetical protein
MGLSKEFRDGSQFVNKVWVPMVPVPCEADPLLWTEPWLGNKGRTPSTKRPSTMPPEVAMALSICAKVCPLQAECLESAMKQEGTWASERHRYGIRGGLLPGQRAALARRREKRKKAAS